MSLLLPQPLVKTLDIDQAAGVAAVADLALAVNDSTSKRITGAPPRLLLL